MAILRSAYMFFRAILLSRIDLAAESVALRQRIIVLQRSVRSSRPTDRPGKTRMPSASLARSGVTVSTTSSSPVARENDPELGDFSRPSKPDGLFGRDTHMAPTKKPRSQ